MQILLNFVRTSSVRQCFQGFRHHPPGIAALDGLQWQHGGAQVAHLGPAFDAVLLPYQDEVSFIACGKGKMMGDIYIYMKDIYSYRTCKN